MTDIYSEIQDDLRRDRMKAIWDRYGVLLIAVAAAVVVAVGGWRGYLYVQDRAAATAGDRYQAASRLATDGKSDEARKAFAELATDGPAGYPQLARLREADEASKSDPAGSLKLYEQIIAGGADPMLQDAARIRAALIAIDNGTMQDVRRFADPLIAGGPWSALARESIGLAAYKAGDMAEARKQFEAITADGDAPGSTRQRADLLLAVLPPEPAPAPAASPARPTN